MSNWFNWYTLIVFIIGVLLSGSVMTLAGRARSKVAGP